MSDQFALGLLAQIVQNLEAKVDALSLRVEELEAGSDPDEQGGTYLDGTPIR